jgi:putative membrane protein
MIDRHGEVRPLVERNFAPPLMVNGAFNMEIGYALAAALLGVAIVIIIERVAMARSR